MPIMVRSWPYPAYIWKKWQLFVYIFEERAPVLLYFWKKMTAVCLQFCKLDMSHVPLIWPKKYSCHKAILEVSDVTEHECQVPRMFPWILSKMFVSLCDLKISLLLVGVISHTTISCCSKAYPNFVPQIWLQWSMSSLNLCIFE